MTRVDEILARAGELPPFPAVIQRVMALMADPLVGADKIIEVVKYDQAITARVIKMCNSTVLMGTSPVSTLRDALVRIGNKQLLQIIMSAGGTELLQRELEGYGLGRGDLWKHSMLCALLAESLCDVVKYGAPDKAFTAGLLHDVGKLAMAGSVADSYEDIREAATAGRISFFEAETRVLGVGHAEIGGRLGELWNFDAEMVAAIRHHHEPAGAPGESKLPFLIHLSDILCLTSGIGVGSDGLQYTIDHDLCKSHGIGIREFELAMIRLMEVEAQFHAIVAMFDREG